jgi:hypothetical protein
MTKGVRSCDLLSRLSEALPGGAAFIVDMVTDDPIALSVHHPPRLGAMRLVRWMFRLPSRRLLDVPLPRSHAFRPTLPRALPPPAPCRT